MASQQATRFSQTGVELRRVLRARLEKPLQPAQQQPAGIMRCHCPISSSRWPGAFIIDLSRATRSAGRRRRLVPLHPARSPLGPAAGPREGCRGRACWWPRGRVRVEGFPEPARAMAWRLLRWHRGCCREGALLPPDAGGWTRGVPAPLLGVETKLLEGHGHADPVGLASRGTVGTRGGFEQMAHRSAVAREEPIHCLQEVGVRAFGTGCKAAVAAALVAVGVAPEHGEQRCVSPCCRGSAAEVLHRAGLGDGFLLDQPEMKLAHEIFWWPTAP